MAAGRQQRRRLLVARWPLPSREPLRHEPLQRALPAGPDDGRGRATDARHRVTRPTSRPSGRRTDRKVYLLTNQDREFLALASHRPCVPAPSRPCTRPIGTWRCWPARRSGRIAYVTNVDGYSELAVLDADGGERPGPVATLPSGRRHDAHLVPRRSRAWPQP